MITFVKKNIISKFNISPLTAIATNLIKDPFLFKKTNLELKKNDAPTEIKKAAKEEINGDNEKYEMRIKYEPK